MLLEVDLRKPHVRRNGYRRGCEPPLLNLPRRAVIDLEDLLVFQKRREAVSASIEACTQDDQLRSAILQSLLHVVINYPGANEHEVGHTGHFPVLAADVVVLHKSPRDRMSSDGL